MDEEKMKGHFLRDPKTGILWLHEYNMDSDYCVRFKGRVLDLATCIDEEYEIVSAVGFGLCFGCDLLVAKNEKGLYAVFTPYEASMGCGNVYASITQGFQYKSVYGFALQWKDYVIAETEYGKWGMIQIAHSRSEWLDPEEPACIPNVVVDFHYDSMEEVESHCPIAINIGDVFPAFHNNRGMGDLTRVEEMFNFANGSGYWGKTTEEIKGLQKIGDTE